MLKNCHYRRKKEDILPYQSYGVEIEPVKNDSRDCYRSQKSCSKSSGGNYINYREHGRTMPRYDYRVKGVKTNKAITIIPTEQGSTRMIELNKEIGRAVGMDILTKTG